MRLKPQGANQTEITLADGTVILFSYETPVACIKGGALYYTDVTYSRTTSKHIGQFTARHGAYSASARPQSFFDTLAKGNA